MYIYIIDLCRKYGVKRTDFLILSYISLTCAFGYSIEGFASQIFATNI